MGVNRNLLFKLIMESDVITYARPTSAIKMFQKQVIKCGNAIHLIGRHDKWMITDKSHNVQKTTAPGQQVMPESEPRRCQRSENDKVAQKDTQRILQQEPEPSLLIRAVSHCAK